MGQIETIGSCVSALFILAVLVLGHLMVRRQSQRSDLIVEILKDFGREAYGLEIQAELKRRCKPMSLGLMYIALTELEDDGRIASRWGEATPERGERRKKYFAVRTPEVKQ